MERIREEIAPKASDGSSPQQRRPAAWWRKAVGVLALVLLAAKYLVPLYALFFSRPPAGDGGQPAAKPAWEIGGEYVWSALLIGLFLYLLLVRKAPQQRWYVFRQIRPAVVAQSAALLAVTIGAACLLRFLFPFLDRSWLYLLPGGDAANVGILPATLQYVGPVFLVLFALCVPEFAWREEMAYRHGTREWKQGCWRSLRFGLAHCVVGVPVFVGLALAVSGLWYTKLYFDGGVEKSTVHHATYNLIVLLLLAAYLATGIGL